MNRRAQRRHLHAIYLATRYDGRVDVNGGSFTYLLVNGWEFANPSRSNRNQLYRCMFAAGVTGSRIPKISRFAVLVADAQEAFAAEFMAYHRHGAFDATVDPAAMMSAQGWGPRFTELARMVAAEADGRDVERCGRIDALLAAYRELDKVNVR